MNLILQVKAFNKLHLRDPFSKGQFMLFHALLDVNNDCGWLEWFDVALARLELFSQLSREGIQKARAELVERGLIEFKSNGTRAGSYRLKKLYEDSTQVSTQRVTKKESLSADLTTEKAENTQISTQVSTQISTQESIQESTSLNKQNKTKQNKTKDMVSGSSYASESFDPNGEQPKDVFDFYEENFGEPSKIVAKDLREMSEKFGDELVIEALKQAGYYNGNYGYAKTILNRWANEGIDSLEKVEAERAKFVKSSEKKVTSYPRTGRVAPMPDRFKNQNETKETKLSPEEEQKLREEINLLRGVAK